MNVNDVEVFQRADGRWDFRIISAENGNTLASSSQGYESREEARKISYRITTGTAGTITFVPTQGEQP